MNRTLSTFVIDPDSELKIAQEDSKDHYSVVGAVLGNLNNEFRLKMVLAIFYLLQFLELLDQFVDLWLSHS